MQGPDLVSVVRNDLRAVILAADSVGRVVDRVLISGNHQGIEGREHGVPEPRQFCTSWMADEYTTVRPDYRKRKKLPAMWRVPPKRLPSFAMR